MREVWEIVRKDGKIQYIPDGNIGIYCALNINSIKSMKLIRKDFGLEDSN